MSQANKLTTLITCENQALRKRVGRRLLSLVVFVVGVLLLIVLLTTADLNKIIAAFRNTIPLYILLACAVRLVAVIVRVLRWKLLFKVQGIHFSLLRLVSTYLTSRFLSNFTPMGLGFQAFSIADTTRLTDKRIKSLVSTSMNTVTNIIVSVPIAILAALINWHGPQYSTLKWVVLGISTVIGLGWIVFWRSEPLVIATISRIRLLDKWSSSQRVSRLYTAVRIYKQPEHRGLFLQIILLSICIRGLILLNTYLDMSAFDIRVPAGQFAALSSVWVLVSIIPAVPRMLGIGDGIRMSLFSLFEIPTYTGLSIALLQRGIILGIDLLGGVALLIRSIIALLSSKK